MTYPLNKSALPVLATAYMVHPVALRVLMVTIEPPVWYFCPISSPTLLINQNVQVTDHTLIDCPGNEIHLFFTLYIPPEW